VNVIEQIMIEIKQMDLVYVENPHKIQCELMSMTSKVNRMGKKKTLSLYSIVILYRNIFFYTLTRLIPEYVLVFFLKIKH